MSGALSHPVSTQESNIIPRVLALKRKIAYYFVTEQCGFIEQIVVQLHS